MSSASNFGKFVVGAMVGGAIGALFGMLLAPRSGVETREMIREEFDNQVDTLRNQSGALKDKAKEKASVLKDRVAEVASELEEVGRKALSRFSDKHTETPS